MSYCQVSVHPGVAYKDVATGNIFSKIYKTRYDSKDRALRFTGSESFTGDIEVNQMLLMASGNNGSIFNIAAVDSFVVSPGKTRKIQLNVLSNEIVGAPIDTNLYSMLAAVDNTSYFSGTRLYYFGARYFDPELGVWLSVDPAGEFYNLYGYHTNPILFIDPTGEDFGITAAIIGAIIGAAVATATTTVSASKEYQQTGSWDWGDYLKDVFIQSNIGGAVGFVTGGMAPGISSGISSGIQSAGGSAFAGATLGGAASGAISGATSYSMNYALQTTTGYQEWDTKDFFTGLGKAALIGGGIGAGTGALTYGLTTHGNDVADVIYEPGTEGEGVVGDIRSGAKHVDISGEGSSSHLKMIYADQGGKKSISWGGGRNNFRDFSIPDRAKGMRITGVDVAKITERGEKLKNIRYRGVINNCGQNVIRSISGIKAPFVTPTINYNYLWLRQALRFYHGL